MTRLLALAMLAAIPGMPLRAEEAPSRQPEPADPNVAVPPVVYESPFTPAHPLVDEPHPWKAANDLVGRIGGWRTYAREASQPESRPADGSDLQPAPPGHDHRQAGDKKD